MRGKIFQALSIDNLETLVGDHSKEFDVVMVERRVTGKVNREKVFLDCR